MPAAASDTSSRETFQRRRNGILLKWYERKYTVAEIAAGAGSITKRLGLHHRVARNHFAIVFSALLGCPLLCLEIDIVNAESLAVPIGPFEVVQQTPQEVALHRITLRSCAMQMRQMIAHIHHAVGVFDMPGSIQHIV